MIYSYTQTTKQLDETRKENKEETRELRKEAKSEEQRIRDRFEQVIQDLNKDRTKLVDGFSNRIDSLERGQRKLFAILEPMKDQIVELRIKNGK
tara:strand:- start:1235 stop:1516 length:282 start_codon:yes stop_codon:yes gene_type:complete